MSWLDVALLFVAGIGGGLTGSIAGLASLTTCAAAVETWATPHRPATVAALDGVVSLGGTRGQTGPANFAGARAGGRRTTINPRPHGGIT